MKELTSRQIEHLISIVEKSHFSTGESSRQLHLRDISPW